MKRLFLVTVMLVIIFVVGGAVLALILNSVNTPTDTTGSPTNPGNNDSTVSTPTVTEKRRAEVNLEKNLSGEYDLVVYNDNLEVLDFQLLFYTNNQFEQFIVNPVFDVTLLNEVNTDGSVSLAFGKLTNREKLNLLKTDNNGFILGSFKLKSGASGEVTLGGGDEENIINDAEGSRLVEPFVATVP